MANPLPQTAKDTEYSYPLYFYEPLKNNLKGWWSRRITQEHRLIYRVEDNSLLIMQCRFHYDD